MVRGHLPRVDTASFLAKPQRQKSESPRQSLPAMAPSTGNRVSIMASPLPGRIKRAGRVFLLNFFWLKSEGRTKKTRHPYVVFLTRADKGGFQNPRQTRAAGCGDYSRLGQR